MSTGRRVAITGVSSHWGAELARRLERDPSVAYIAGIDSRPPPAELVRTEFIEADLRSSTLSRLLPSTEVDTVVHCGILWYPEPGRPPRVLHEINVIGTLQLLAACERTETPALGGRPRLGGDLRLRGRGAARSSPRTWPAPRRCAPAFSATSPSSRSTSTTSPAATRELRCCMLRFQPEVGPGLDEPAGPLPDPARWSRSSSASTRACSCSTPRTGSGRSRPRSPTRSAGRSTSRPTARSRSAGRCGCCGRPTRPAPGPAFDALMRRFGERLGAGGLAGDGVRLLRYGRGVDNARLQRELGFRPRLDAVGAIRALAAADAAGASVPDLHPGTIAGRLTGVGVRGRATGERAAVARAGPARGGGRVPARRARRGRVRPRPAGRRPAGGGLAAAAAALGGRGDRPPPPGRLPRGRVGVRRGLRRGGLPDLRVPLRGLVAGRGDRGQERARPRAALLVSNHAGLAVPVRRDDDHDGDHEAPPAAAVAALHGPRLGLRAPVPVLVHAPRRRRPGEPAQRHPAARTGRARDGLPRGRSRGPASRSPSATGCSASAAAASSRSPCAPARRSSPSPSSARRRSTRSSARARRWRAPSGRRSCR